MNRALWITRKNHLCSLIKRVSDENGGDDIEFVRQVCRETLEMHPQASIELAIQLYEGCLKIYVKMQKSPETAQNGL